ncbi:MAG: T9SS type A sorting domain-containing protein [Brumimicrobium sp.]
MKNLLLAVAVLSGSVVWGQSSSRPAFTPKKADYNFNSSSISSDLTVPKTTACTDTVRYPQLKEQIVGASQFYYFELWTDDAEEISQKYELTSGSMEITAVEFLGGNHPSEPTPSVTVEVGVYNVDASNNPTTLLGSGSATIADTNNFYRQINLTTPVTVTNDYAVVIKPTNGGGIVRFFLNDLVPSQVQDEDLARVKSSYYPNSGGAWVSPLTLTTGDGTNFPNGPYDFEGLISPIVNYTLDASFTTSPSPICDGDPVDFTNTSAEQGILGSKMYSFYNFLNEFGLAPTDTTYAYDFGDGNAAFAENPTYTYGTDGTYDVEIYNFGGLWSGCTESTIQQVVVNPADDASFSYSASEFCSTSGNETPTGVVSTGTFSATPAGLVFADASTGEVDIASSTPGTYDITFTTNGTCPNSSTVAFTINDPADAGFSYSQAQYCSNDPNATATLDAGATAGTFSATPTGLVFADASTGEIDMSGSTAGNYTVTNTVAATGGCPQQTASTTVEVIAADDATFAYSSSTFCTGSANETPTINATGTFSSTPAGLDFADASTGEIDMGTSADGTYDITFTTNGACPSSSTESITITNAPDASFSYSAPEYCADEGPQAPSFVPGSSAGTFTADPTTGLSISASNGTITLSTSTPGTYDVTNTIPASGSCPQATATQTVTINGLPNVDAGTNQDVCDGDQVTLSGAGADSYSWDNGVTDGSPFTPTVGTVTYTVTGTDVNGCENTDQVDVTVNEVPTIDAGTDTEICEGEEVTLTATASLGNVSWDNGVTDGAPFTPTTTTTYNATADNNGCTATDDVTVTVNSLPTVDAGSDETLCENHNPLTLSGTPTGGIYSGTSVTGNEFDPNDAGVGTYTITYTYEDGNGCEASDDVTLTVDGCASIDENTASNGLTIMPNPASEYIDVVMEGKNEIKSMQLMSAEGRIVQVNMSSLNTNTTRIDLSNVSNGTYLIQMNTTVGQVIKRVIVQ